MAAKTHCAIRMMMEKRREKIMLAGGYVLVCLWMCRRWIYESIQWWNEE